jgi:hypothetical protein
MLVPNQRADNPARGQRQVIEYWRDGTTHLPMEDAAPYESGWFALRTTYSHLRISHLRIRRMP